jgi:hypothetical protein
MIRLLCLPLLTLLAAACGPAPEREASAEAAPQRQDIRQAREQAGALSPYALEWGGLRIPLAKYAQPEVFKGEVELELEDFRRLIGQPLRLLKHGAALEVEVASLHREPFSRFDPFWYSFPEFDGSKLGEAVAAAFRQGIRPGDRVALRLASRADSIIVQSAVLKIRDPFEAYQPEVPLPRPRYDGETYGFQLIKHEGQRPILRLDTSAASTRHVLEMYQSNRLYKIIHVPGFATRRRLLDERELLFLPTQVRRAELLGCGHDWLSLPEFTAFGDANVRLQWGEMRASPSSENYLLSDFHSNIPQPLRLYAGERELPIRSFHLYTHGRARQAELYVADSLATPDLLKALYRLQPASTVYFSNIIVEAEEGQLCLLPVSFAFNISAEHPYELQIGLAPGNRSAPVLIQLEEPGHALLHLKAMPLSQAVPLLLGLDSTQLRRHGWRQDPLLDIRFRSAHYGLEDGKALAWRELQQRYGLHAEWAPGQETYRLLPKDSIKLAQFAEQTERDPYRRIDTHDKTAFFRFIAPQELARFLSDELSVPIADHTALPPGTRLSLELDFSSLAAARESLARIGLALALERQGEVVVGMGIE